MTRFVPDQPSDTPSFDQSTDQSTVEYFNGRWPKQRSSPRGRHSHVLYMYKNYPCLSFSPPTDERPRLNRRAKLRENDASKTSFEKRRAASLPATRISRVDGGRAPPSAPSPVAAAAESAALPSPAGCGADTPTQSLRSLPAFPSSQLDRNTCAIALAYCSGVSAKNPVTSPSAEDTTMSAAGPPDLCAIVTSPDACGWSSIILRCA